MKLPDSRGYARECPTRSLDLTKEPDDRLRWEWHAKRFNGTRYANRRDQLIAKGVHMECENILARIAWIYKPSA